MDLVEIVDVVVRHIVDNWRRYAYVDNPRCARINIALVLKRAVKRVQMHGRKKSRLYMQVMDMLRSRGFTILSSDLKTGPRGGVILELCLDGGDIVDK